MKSEQSINPFIFKKKNNQSIANRMSVNINNDNNNLTIN